MTVPIFKDHAGQIINKWQEWTPPNQVFYWTEGLNEMELARSWFESDSPQCPSKLQALFARNTHTKNIEIDAGYPKFVTPLPGPGEGRVFDLMLKAHTPAAPGVICIEATTAETFGKTIGEYWQEEKAQTESSAAPKHIQALVEIVFGAKAHPERQPWCDLRYQLLTAVAGTLLQAGNEQVPWAAFVVHEFRIGLAKPEILKANAADYARFVGALFTVRRTSNSQMYGPLRVQTGNHLPQSVELFVGKATSKGHVYVPGSMAKKMAAEGKSEELFAILLSQYEYLKRRYRDVRPARHIAREIDYLWTRCNPDENSRNRLRVIIERDIPDLWP